MCDDSTNVDITVKTVSDKQESQEIVLINEETIQSKIYIVCK